MIALEGASRRFGGIDAVGPVDLHVAAGEFVAIVGPSGCGKSTLLRLIAGLTPATGGKVLVDGRPVDGPAPDRGVVFQQPALFPWLTASSNVAFGLREAGMPADRAAASVRRWLDAVGLAGFEQALPAQLSGGMAQRAALARALAPEPRTLLLDEPLGALDRITRQEMQDLLAAICRDSRRTVVLVTHDVEEAVYLADRVTVMSRRPGRIVADIVVGLPRPRPGRTDAAFVAARARVEEALAVAMSRDPADAGQPATPDRTAAP